jgi:hydroxyacylglutathione hydrolase
VTAALRRALLVGLVLLVAGALLILGRHRLMVYGLALEGAPALLEAAEEAAGTRWVDDYFTVTAIDARSFAIGEPRYAQQNHSYLIAGSERAVLFDAGPGLRDIRAVAESLTELPITFIPSHFHYDHIGNQVTFEHVAVVDLPYLRERAPDGRLQLGFGEHLGAAEGIEAPILEVDEWLAPGGALALGDRTLRVLYTPGHTEDSISLLDLESGALFSGDFLYPGPLFAFLPNSGMGDYLAGADVVLAAAPPRTRVFGAHRLGPPGLPELARSDVEDLRVALVAIRDGELEGTGLYPVVYPVNDRVELWAEPGWLQRWSRSQ